MQAIRFVILLLALPLALAVTHYVELSAVPACATTGGCDLLSILGLVPAPADSIVVSSLVAGDFLISIGSILTNSVSVSGSSTTNITASVSTGASLVVNTLSIAQKATLDVKDGATLIASNTVSIAEGGVIVMRSNGKAYLSGAVALSGSLLVEADANVDFFATTVTLGAGAVVRGSVFLANSTYFYASSGFAYLSTIVVTGVNNTIDSATGSAVEISGSVTVAAGASLVLVTNISVAAASLIGNAQLRAQGVVTFIGNVNADTDSTFAVDASATVSLTGTLTLVNSAALRVNGTFNATEIYVNSLNAGSNAVFRTATLALVSVTKLTVNSSLALYATNSTIRVGAIDIQVNGNASLQLDTSSTVSVGSLASVGVFAIVNGRATINSITAESATSFSLNRASVTITGTYSSSGPFYVYSNSSVTVGNGQAAASFSGGITCDSSSANIVTVALQSSLSLTSESFITTLRVLNFSTLSVSAFTTVVNSVVSFSDNTVVGANFFMRGTSSYTQLIGKFTLAGGFFSNNVFIGSATSTSASIAGNGNINGSLSVFGTVAIGNSPGTIYVTGDYKLDPVSTYNLEIASDTNFDKAFVGGNVVLGGALKIFAVDGYSISTSKSYTFITCNKTASSSFNSVTTPYAVDRANQTVSLGSRTGASTAYPMTTSDAAVTGLCAAVAVLFVVISLIM